MKLIVPVLCLFALTSIANAGQENRGGPTSPAPQPGPAPAEIVYHCDVLSSPGEGPLLGAPEREIVFEHVSGSPILRTISGADWGGPLTTKDAPMKEIGVQPEMVTYEADGIVAYVSQWAGPDGITTSVAIEQQVGKRTLTAKCELKQ